jgi:cytochrome c biogenesis protein CcmG/thiol:disulfide interchange protein DsbE
MQQSKIGAKVGLAVAALLLVAIAGLVAFGGNDSTGTETPGAVAVPAGSPAPEVELAYLDGGTATLAALEGKPVVLNFFADWCPACVAEMPDFQAVHEELGDDVVFLGVDRSTTTDGAKALLADTGVTYSVALDRDGEIFRQFEGIAMPTTVFIDAAGNVIDRHNGVIFEDDLRARVHALFPGA